LGIITAVQQLLHKINPHVLGKRWQNTVGPATPLQPFQDSVFCADHLTDVYGKKYDRSFIVFELLSNLSTFLQNRI
jgi:hypothetical protein